MEVEIDAPAATVFRLFTEPDLLVKWIGISADLEPTPGGIFRFEIAPGQFCRGSYLEVVPPHRVVFTWGYEGGAMPLAPASSTVEVDIRSVGERSSVRLVHRGLAGPMKRMHEEGWTTYVIRLGAVAEGRDPGPDPAAPYQDGALPQVPGT